MALSAAESFVVLLADVVASVAAVEALVFALSAQYAADWLL
jgi:hypothetical protein